MKWLTLLTLTLLACVDAPTEAPILDEDLNEGAARRLWTCDAYYEWRIDPIGFSNAYTKRIRGYGEDADFSTARSKAKADSAVEADKLAGTLGSYYWLGTYKPDCRHENVD